MNAVVDPGVIEQPRGEDESTGEPDRDYLKLARDAYRASTTFFDANIRREIENDLRQWQSQHSQDSKYNSPRYAGRSKLFRPKTRSSIQHAEAQAAEALFSTVDVIVAQPWDEDSTDDIAEADFTHALLKPRLAEKPDAGGVDWYLTCMGAFQDAMVTGICISKQHWIKNPKRGVDRPCIDLVPIENFRFDPAADWRRPAQTSPYLIELIPMYVTDVKSWINSGKFKRVDEGAIMAAARRVEDSIRQQRNDKRTDNTTVSHAVNDFSIVWVHLNIINTDDEQIAYYTLGESTLLSDPVPLTQMFAHGIPYAIGFTTVEAHKVYPSGPVRIGRPLQREINDLANSRLDNVAFVLNKRYFAKRGAQVDVQSITRNMPASVTLMNDPEKDVKVVDTSDVTGSSYKEADLLNVEMDDVVGQFSQQSVQTNRNLNETVGGMNLLAASGNLVGSYRLLTFTETWMEVVLTQLRDMLVFYEDDEDRLARAAIAADLDETVSDDVLFRRRATMRVDMSMGALSPQDRANRLLFGFTALRTILDGDVLQRYGLDIQEVAKEIFSMIGYRDGSRFFQWEGGDPQVIAMQGEIDALRAALEAKMPPQIMEATVRKLGAEAEKVVAETISKRVEAMYSAMQAGQVVASVPSVAPVADGMLGDAGFVGMNQPGPGIEAPAQPAPELMQGDVMDPRTGVSFVPGGGENPNPMLPAPPAQPDDGQNAGIETPEGGDNIRGRGNPES